MRRLSARDRIPDFGDNFFSYGGIDVLAASPNENRGDQTIDPVDAPVSKTDYEWIYTQLECLFSATQLKPGDKLPAAFDAIGLWYQIYDHETKQKRSSGVISFFGPATPSVIEHMQPIESIIIDPFCSTH